MKGTVHTHIENAIATITFQHPASNACDPEMLAEMAGSIKNLNSHSGVKLILLQSGGEKAFCAG
ncbi:enoyl-CoA hydratase-related protein, partial [Flavobacteriaceae bacterium]|nr:enoyl-CoA hydratase-related protein [Flavobacteriaceae bacterium]